MLHRNVGSSKYTRHTLSFNDGHVPGSILENTFYGKSLQLTIQIHKGIKDIQKETGTHKEPKIAYMSKILFNSVHEGSSKTLQNRI